MVSVLHRARVLGGFAAGILAFGASATAVAAPPEPATATSSTEPEPLMHCKRFAPTAHFRVTLPEEATLDDAVRWMSSVSCVRFILDPKLRSSKVTIIAPEPVTLQQAYNAFYSALQVMGLAVVPAGSYQKIVEAPEVAGQPLPVVGPSGQPSANDRYVTKLYRPRSGDVEGIAALMGNFVSKSGSVVWVDDIIILTDTGANIRRILKIVAVNDKPKKSKERVFFYQLRSADPEATAEIIRELFPEADVSAPASKPRAKPKPRPRSKPSTRR